VLDQIYFHCPKNLLRDYLNGQDDDPIFVANVEATKNIVSNTPDNVKDPVESNDNRMCDSSFRTPRNRLTITLARGEIIHPVDLPEEIRHYQATTRGTLMERLDALEREIILSALEKRNWVQTQAAELLGINERVLRYKMKKHAISKEDL
jgi:transcriptional regulator with GAF, ATPase, and Fis domain